MIPIPAELAGKLAQTFRGTPALLTIILINTLFMGIVVWALWISAEFRYKERTDLIRVIEKERADHLQMLDRCISSGRGKTGTKGTDESGTTTPIGTTQR